MNQNALSLSEPFSNWKTTPEHPTSDDPVLPESSPVPGQALVDPGADAISTAHAIGPLLVDGLLPWPAYQPASGPSRQ